ncbi:hypothetical protein FEAC_14170 [Ferrimicrobium acidiphilum DSM 19497]|uniref:Uncharacterized protein n=1 Tax=Ferrimicrobium acidiphilum DSM 19497 TaxID=1121877 RepID=A0A0D8FUJ6_9ACTN|nr:hypothetical protein [Ferrimicrobium acidiphilum]KJE76771.1 hypothetical protein FEAC_14170 [Ferrimicrobium acidiphilum DSM 19497]
MRVVKDVAVRYSSKQRSQVHPSFIAVVAVLPRVLANAKKFPDPLWVSDHESTATKNSLDIPLAHCDVHGYGSSRYDHYSLKNKIATA